MSVTYALNGAGTVVAGALLHLTGSRWIWAGGAVSFAVGAMAAYGLAREAQTVPIEASEASD